MFVISIHRKIIAPQHNNIPHKTEYLPLKTHMLKITYNQLNKSSNLLYKARLHTQKWGGDKSTTLKTHQNIGNNCVQQMANRGKAVHDAIMRSPTDTNMEDINDTMVVEVNQSKRAQETKKKAVKASGIRMPNS
jgi:hypothetical protein